MRMPAHPGIIIRHEIDALGTNIHALAMALHVPSSRLDQIIKGKRRVSSDTAIRPPSISVVMRPSGSTCRAPMILL